MHLIRIYHVLLYLLTHPEMFLKAWRSLRHDGIQVVFEKTKNFFTPNTKRRKLNYYYIEPKLVNSISKIIRTFKTAPLISIVMPVYDIDPQWLLKAIESIKRQWYPHWELCIVDDASTNPDTIAFLKKINDPRIQVDFLLENQNISTATNAAIAMAQGEFIALMDNDDELTPDALFEIVCSINETDADFIYSDEDYIGDRKHNIFSTSPLNIPPLFKPDYSPDLLLTHNYITHLSVIRKSLIDRIGGFRSAYDGAQDYDLFLRLSEQTNKIVHIPKVLYHWRMLQSSSSVNANAKPLAQLHGQQALEEALKRRNITAEVLEGNQAHFFRVKRDIKPELISILIPFKDQPELLQHCIESIIEKSSYPHFEIIGISNNSILPATFDLIKSLSARDSRIRFVEYNHPFNFSAINNFAVFKHAKGEHILMLNNDTSVITPDWLEAMLEHSQRPEVACVGAKLFYPDDTIQHAGVIIGIGGVAGHSHKFFAKTHNGFVNRLNAIQNLSAVTGACLMIKKTLYHELNGLNETKLSIAFNDIDFCLRAREKEYLNIFTPYAELYHYESKSRGHEDTPEKIERFNKEKSYMLKRHATIINSGDPYYNLNLTLDHEDFSFKTE